MVSLVSGEVKHVVHLIRWNLNAVLCQLGQELTACLEWLNARLLGLGTESCFNFFVISSTIPHWSPISCVLPSPGRLAPSRAEVFVGFAVSGWFRRFRPPPPPLVLFRVLRPSAFLFPCLSRVCPLRARCVVLVFSPSSFAFPSSRPG